MSSRPHSIGGVAPKTLAATRLQLHHAAWVVGSAAHSLIPAREDDSHTNLGYGLQLGVLTTHRIPGESHLQIALGLRSLELLFFEAEGRVSHVVSTTGLALAQALEAAEAGARRFRPEARISARNYADFPTWKMSAGFEAQPSENLTELDAYYATTAALLGAVEQTHAGASPTRTWPHHFDMATLIHLPEMPGAPARSIGVGMSPGDAAWAQPYWYVSPYPYPDPQSLPAWEGPGAWHVDGFVALVLTASEWLEAAAEPRVLETFVAEAIAACEQLLV
jgi:hypothetical protein